MVHSKSSTITSVTHNFMTSCKKIKFSHICHYLVLNGELNLTIINIYEMEQIYTLFTGTKEKK